MVKSKTFGKDLRLLVIESFKNGFSTKKIFENVQKFSVDLKKISIV